MKKFIIILSILLGMTAIESFAQTQVRGIETRRIIYEGSIYDASYGKKSTKYYGWEITNHNSITVSVEIELWSQTEDGGHIVKTQDIILKSKETYIFKREEHECTRVDLRTEFPISNYYIKYKAYKLE